MSNPLYSSEVQQFLKSVPNLIIAGYGGSYAYGTNSDSSDIDIRGIYVNPIDELLGITPDSEQKIDTQTDTVIYSFHKMIKLLADCNPNTIELLGLRPQDYLYLTEAGQLLLDNRQLFLSKKAIRTFGNYAASQLNRLVNKSGRGKDNLVGNEVRSINNALSSFSSRYKGYAGDYSGIEVSTDGDDIMLSLHLEKLPIKIVMQMLNELASIDKDYTKSSRNSKAIEHNKLSKHMMHLLRLYMMGIDILEKGEIITYRADEHDMLMSIRRGDYLEDDGMTPTQEFEQLLAEYQARFNNATAQTKLPDNPDYAKINELAVKINTVYLETSQIDKT